MARIPLPERGQPLDLTYIYQLANSINEISNQLSPSVSKYSAIDGVEGPLGRQSVRTSDLKFIGGYLEVNNNFVATADDEEPFSYQFLQDFVYPPIVVATPILIGDNSTESSTSASVILQNITTTQVNGIVKFDTPGNASVGINLIIMGISV
jgi:hypothetical protein